jgi:glycosyltransferase involved in cell wall biosynthesis
MNVISISTDRKIFEDGSAVRARQIEYGALFGEMHIVVFTSLFSRLPRMVQIAPNVWVYGTHSFSKFLYMRDASRLSQKILKERAFTPENVVVTTQDPFETGVVGARLARTSKLPLHVQIHTDFLNQFFKKGSFLNACRVRLARRVLPHADAVRVVSERIAASLKSWPLKSGAPVDVLPIFIDTEKIERSTAVAGLDLRKKYPQFSFIILMASRLTEEKNIGFGIRVFKKLQEEYSGIGLVVVGEGPEKGRLKSLARKLGIQKHVVFEGWQNDLISYYKSAHLLLITSSYEGYGMTIVEAIAARCPVVSTDVGVAGEILRQGKESCVCEVGNMEQFFNAISRLIEDSGLRETLVHEAAAKLQKVVVSDKVEYLGRYQRGIESVKKLVS